MNKTQFISQLNAKDDVLSPFLVKYIATAEGKDGKTYLNVILADNSGELEAQSTFIQSKSAVWTPFPPSIIS